MNDDQITRFLEVLGRAISGGDVAAIARCWDVPALVLADEGVIAVSTSEEVERFFTQAQAWYRSQGLVATRPLLQQVQRLTERIAAVDVRWSTLDEAGAERTSETSHYLLRLADDGQPRIRVALTRSGAG
jgi:hypothetical protein